jgi:hypothetical protein
MLYQLPNGKTINLDISDVLSMTDADIQYLLAINAGDVIINPFHGSAIKHSQKPDEDDEYSYEEEVQESYYEEYFPDEVADEETDFDINSLDPNLD